MSRSQTVRGRRLAAQLIARPAGRAADVVAWLGAVQAQDYLASLRAVGLRTPRATASTIEQAIADGSIVRTHVFRGTLQYVAREDVRWMLALVADRVIAGSASRYRALGLDERTLRRAARVLGKATSGAQLTRAEVAAALQGAGIRTDGQRLIHIIVRAELDAEICSGARGGKQQTFAAFDDRVPAAPARSRDHALGELARRFFRSRGPATLRDFMWWTGLRVGDARVGLAAIAGEMEPEAIAGVEYWSFGSDGAGGRGAEARKSSAHSAYLLPAFDEYLVGYQDRRAVLHADHVRLVNAGGGLLAPCVVVDGRVLGVWRRSLGKAGVAIEFRLFGTADRRARTAVGEAAERYATFVGAPLASVMTA